ncbi:MAG: IPT/TIG domain-containing protein [Patescibacteria group bacterium]|nr:IPT/TIG domain-containing protein [Patescibacteria group bacterium]
MALGNRSHVFVDPVGGVTAHEAKGDFNEPFATLALGIDAVVPGGTVYVAAGTYYESPLIEKSLKLVGVGETKPVITGLASTSYIIKINCANDVLIDNLEINGGGDSVGDNGFDYGIFVNNSGTSDNPIEISNSMVKNIWKNSGNGIEADAGSYVLMHDNDISSFHKRGIRFINSEGKVYDNEVVGDNVDGTSRVQNLVNLWGGSTAEIYDNILHNALTIGETPTWDSPGIFVTSYGGNGASQANIHNNEIYDCDSGIIVGSYYATTDNSTATITNNNFHSLNQAINFEKGTASATVSENKFSVVNKAINADDGDGGPDIKPEINAENNWWGSEDPDFATLVYDAVDYSPWWVTSTGPSSEVPAKPTLISLTTPTKNNKPTLSWNAVSAKPEVKNYSVEIMFGEMVVGGDTDLTTFTPTDALADGNYTWQVKATNSMGDSEFSDAGSFAIDTTSLAPASLTAGSATASSLVLSWTNSESNGSYYIIKRSTSPITAENFDAAMTLGGAPTVASGSQGYVAKNLTAGTTYYFAIQVTDALGNVSDIVTTSGTTLAPTATPSDSAPPAAITNLSASAGSPATSQIKLTWTATGDDGNDGIATKYTIKRSTNAITDDASFEAAITVFNTLSPKSSGSPETFTVTGLSANTTYYFAIKAVDKVSKVSDLGNSSITNRTTADKLPTISSIDKTEGVNNVAVAIIVTGKNFDNGTTTLRFSNSSNTFELAATVNSATQLTASVPIGAPEGVYSLKVINGNGASAALSSAYTVKVAPTPLPTVSDLIPANIGSNDFGISLTIYGNNFTGATAVSIDTAPETTLTVTSISSTKIVATILGTISAGTYNIKVTTVGGTNAISSVKLNVKEPVAIDSGLTQDKTTNQPLNLSTTNVIPVQITLQSDETIVNTDTVATIEVVIPPATKITKADGTTAYTGNINPPQIVKTTEEMKEKAGNDAIVITMGNPDEKITFSNDFVTTVTLESTNTTAPLIWYYKTDGTFEIAGKDGMKDGITYAKGGTVLNTVNNGGVYTYTIGLLLDHMSSYVAGVNPSITSVSPSSAKAGETVTITGTNFSTSATVKFGATSASVSSLTTTSISVAVPSIRVGSYNIVVTNSDGLASNAKAFSITAAPSTSIGGPPFWMLQQPQPAKPATPAIPKVSPAVPATPATPAVPGKPAPQVLGEKIYADGTLVRGKDKKIFVIENGQKKYIANLKELAKYAGQKIYDVENTILIQYPEVLGTKVLADGALIRGADGKIYVIKNGQKQHIRSLEELRKNYLGKKIYDVSDETLAKY